VAGISGRGCRNLGLGQNQSVRGEAVRGTLFALMFVVVSPAFAQQGQKSEVGRVEGVRANFAPDIGDAYILRDGRQIAPRAHVLLLYPGDQIVVRVPQLIIDYSEVGSDQLKQVTSQSSPVRLPDSNNVKPGFCTLFNCHLVFNLRQHADWIPIVIRTRTHAGEAVPVVPSRFLQTGVQYLPRDATQIAVIWAGGAGTVRVGQTAGAGSQSGFEILPRPGSDAFLATVTGEDSGTLTWPVRVVDREPPAPASFSGRAAPSNFDRLERALYILQPSCNCASWHLFAISELAVLRQTSITADIAWRQVVTGKYQPEG